MIDRLPTPVGARPARRRARPREHQGRLARVREDRRAAGLPLLRQRRGRRDRLARRARSSSTTRSSTPSARRPTGGSGSPARTCPGSWPATAFVAWYNGHPDFQDLEFDLSHERVVVIGNGNVAIDCARMLALTAEELAPTDTTRRGDRGDRRLAAAGDRDARPPRPGAGGVHAARAEGARRARRRRRRSSTPPTSSSTRRASASSRPTASARGATSSCCASTPRARPTGKPRRIVLRFLVSPVAILGEDRVEGVEVVRNELVEENGRIVARPTGETETIPCGLVLRSVGYRGVPLPGVPFDERTRHDPERRAAASTGAERTYVAGWIKRGPSGVIGTNKKDATETVELLLEDARAGKLVASSRAATLEDAARRARRALRRVRGLAGDRRRRARRRRAARPAAREARDVGRAAANRPDAAGSLARGTPRGA